MKVAISGANGYIGNSITLKLRTRGYEIIKIPRKLLYGNHKKLAEFISEADSIIHLAGAPILQRWTKSNKETIVKSRTQTTKNLVHAISIIEERKQAKVFLSASAIGIYKNGSTHTESSKDYSDGFVSNVVSEWENASEKLPGNIRRVVFRIGLVIGKKAKTISNLIPVFKLGLGATIGNGQQAFPFIHIEDLTNAMVWFIENNKTEGIYNLVSPENITNKKFTQEIARVLKRRAFFSIPKFILKLALGKASVLLTESPQVIPKKLLDEGFEFKYSSIKDSLSKILAKKNLQPKD